MDGEAQWERGPGPGGRGERERVDRERLLGAVCCCRTWDGSSDRSDDAVLRELLSPTEAPEHTP